MNYKFSMDGKWRPENYNYGMYGSFVPENYMDKIFGAKKSEKEIKQMKVTIFYEIADVAYECATVVKYYMIPDDEPGQIFKYEYIKSNMFTTVHEVEGYVDGTVDLYKIKERIHGIILENIRIHKYEHNRTFRWIFKELDYVDATRLLCYRQRANSGRYTWKDTDYSAFSWKCNLPDIKNVIYNMPATIVEWSDGTKTVSKCEDGEIFDREKGLMAAYMQKMESIKGRKLWKTLNKWLPKGLDMDNEPVNENMSTYVQSKLSRDYEKACKKAKTVKSLKEYVLGNVMKLTNVVTKEEAEYIIKNDIMATADAVKSVAEIWDSLPKDVKEAAESKIAEAVEQANIDDDQTKEPALEKKNQLNQEFDKMMNPPVDNDTPEYNKWSLRKDRPLNKTTVDRHKYLPVLESHDGFDRYEKSSYLTPSEASKWLRKNDHDIVVAIDEYKGIYYTGEDMSWQLMSRIIETIDTHDIHNVVFNRHREMLYPPIESWESLNGKPRKIGTPDKLINFEYLCLMVVR